MIYIVLLITFIIAFSVTALVDTRLSQITSKKRWLFISLVLTWFVLIGVLLD